MTDTRFEDLAPDHPLNKLPAGVFRGNDFEPKLNFAQRCSILALSLRNISVAHLAAAFDVNRRTVNKIVKPDSDRYKAVRDELAAMGETDFVAKYVTEEIALRVANAASLPEVKEDSKTYDANVVAKNGPNVRATVRRGINTIKEERHSFSHRIEVDWLEADTAVDDNGPFEHPAGWYWRDLDSDTPERWQGDPEANSHLTSTAAFEHARKNA